MERQERLARLSNIEVNINSVYYLHYVSYHKELKYAINLYAKGDLLDIGCGNKPYESLFDGLITKYIGCDIIQSNLYRVDILSPANKIPLEDCIFDTIISTQTIEHVEDYQGLVNEAYRLLKPDGHFILSGPFVWPLHEEPYDFFRFTKHGFKFILDKAGFEVLEILSNGGMWATAGQTLIHAIESTESNNFLVKLFAKLYQRFKIRILFNKVFSWLDERFYNDINTINYVIVAKKN